MRFAKRQQKIPNLKTTIDKNVIAETSLRDQFSIP